MKKNFFIAVLFSIFCILFFGCNFSYEAEPLSPAPTVDFNNNSTDKSVAISIPKKINSAKYINVYRQDVTENSEESEIENIGMFYPKFTNTQNSDSAFIFFDSYISKGHKYKYRVRYADSDEYLYSNWSKEIEAKDGYDENAALSYGISNVKFSYDKDSYLLKINGTITTPDSALIENFDAKFKPMIIIKSEDKTQAFPLSSLEDGTQIQLRGLLSSDFLDRPIKIAGIVPQENVYVKDENSEAEGTSSDGNSETEDEEDARIPDIKEIHWLKLSKIKVTGSGVSDNTITIPSSTQSSGFDYSKKAN